MEGEREGVSHAGVMIVGAGGGREERGQSSVGRLGRAGEIPWNGAIKWAKTDDGMEAELEILLWSGVNDNVGTCLLGQRAG